MCRLQKLVFLLFTLSISEFVNSVNSSTVCYSSGCVLGKEEKDFSAWLGVPFAQPPVGPLRFKVSLNIKSNNKENSLT